MPYKIITDPVEMDLLWEAGLLWYNNLGPSNFKKDITNTLEFSEQYRPSKNRHCCRAIYIEE